MNSRIFHACVSHSRLLPQPHKFDYGTFLISLCLDDLEDSARHCSPASLLSYNRMGLFSIYDRDYLEEGSDSIKQKLLSFLGRDGNLTPPARTHLVTTPRLFGYVFNPVSFFFSFDKDGNFHSLVAEVNNTFGEKHLYLLEIPNTAKGHLPVSFIFSKEFYVSPFLAWQGDYLFSIKEFGNKLGIKVALRQDNKINFCAQLVGVSHPLTNLNLLLSLARYFISALLTMSRIHLQALMLYFFKDADAFQRPNQAKLGTISGTVRSRQSLIHKVRERILESLKRFKRVGPGGNPFKRSDIPSA